METVIRSAAGSRRGRTAGIGIVTALALALAAGCVQVKETLTINADGSGTVRIETVTFTSSSVYRMLANMLSSQALAYPPVTRQAVSALFPKDDFTVSVERNRAVPRTTGVIVEAQFKDINALLKSPYGEAHSLELSRDGDQLVLKARSGMQTLARLAPFIRAEHKGDMPVRLDTAKDNYGELAFEFTVVMPAEAQVEGAGATVEGNTISWTAKLAGAEDEAKLLDQLDSVITLRCPAKDVAFEPVKTTRLDLVPFGELKEQPVSEAPPIDLEKIKAATRFVPLVLQVTQSFNLAGEGFRGENSASLRGVVIVPRELEPVQWGEAKLEAIEDDQGEDLMLKGDQDDSRYGRLSREYERMNMLARRARDGEEPPDVTHPVSLAFIPPSFEARTIARLEATITMRYPGGTHLVCVKDAIAKDLIENTSLEKAYEHVPEDYYPGDDEEEDGAKPVLDKLGVTLTLQKASRVEDEDVLVLDFTLATEAGSVLQAQVFDANGRAWPTSVVGYPYYMPGAGRLRLCVAGEPEPPLSLAFIVKAVGPAVEVPIKLKDVPILPAEKENDTKPDTEETPKDE